MPVRQDDRGTDEPRARQDGAAPRVTLYKLCSAIQIRLEVRAKPALRTTQHNGAQRVGCVGPNATTRCRNNLLKLIAIPRLFFRGCAYVASFRSAIGLPCAKVSLAGTRILSIWPSAGATISLVGLDEDDIGQHLAGANRIALGDQPLVHQRLDPGLDIFPRVDPERELDHAAALSATRAFISFCAASTMLPTCGMTNCSSGRLYGIGTLGTASRLIGAFSANVSRFSATMAEISPVRPKPR